MDILLVALVAAAASALTLVSGFGLGTILLPVFALFFPVPTAVAATGAVHLLNNLFKGTLLYRRADWRVVLRLAIPAIPAAILGAWLLARLGTTPRLFEWQFGGYGFGPTGAHLCVGLLLILFALLEFWPRFQRLEAPARLMPLGGLLTGFFGGLTGQQGALRSLFLLRAGLSPQAFIASGAMIAIAVDLSRLGTYASAFAEAGIDPQGREALLVAFATLAALAGAWIAAKRIDKVTIGWVRLSVAGLMLTIGAALSAGLIGVR
jgi:uncharacterized membrane protein YfcA